jgi:hypothetical protein
MSVPQCPKCGEWRATLISQIIDPMGKRYYCSVCAHEFKIKGLNAPPRPDTRLECGAFGR